MNESYSLVIKHTNGERTVVRLITSHYVSDGVLHCVSEHRGSYYSDREVKGSYPIANIIEYKRMRR